MGRPGAAPRSGVRRRVALRRALAAASAGLLLIALAAPVAANGGLPCEVSGASTSGGPIDLVATPIWHLRSTDHVTVTATAPAAQADVFVNAYVLGFPIPLASGTGSEGDTFATGEAEVADFAAFGRVFVIGGSSVGAFGSCTAQFQVIIDDVDPLTTPIGIGSVAITLVALGVTALAVRRPGSRARRVATLIGYGLTVGAGSVVLQQFGSADLAAGFGASAVAVAVPGPTGIVIDPVALGQAAGLSLLLVIVLPFPAELFNRTLEVHLDEVRGWFGWLPWMRPTEAATAGSGGAGRAFGIGLFVLASAALYSLLDPGIGLDAGSAATFVGVLIGLLAVTWLASLPRRAAQRALTGDPGKLRAVSGTLVIAALCVVISRLTGFLPGYLYGLILGYEFARSLEPADKARALSAGAWWMLGLAAVSWLMLGAVRAPGVGDTWPGVVAENVLGAIAVAGVEGIVFALLPMRFLYGEPIFRWSRFRWGLLYFAGMFAFVVVILNPASGFATAPDQASFQTAVALFIGFGLASLLLWGYFRFRPSRASG